MIDLRKKNVYRDPESQALIFIGNDTKPSYKELEEELRKTNEKLNNLIERFEKIESGE